MANINRSNIIQKAVNDLALSQATDKIPSETLDKIQLVYSLNQEYSSFVLYTVSTTTASASVPIDANAKDIYLTSITGSYIKDATCDVATGTVGVTITPDESNVSTGVISFAVLTLTAQSGNISIDFPYPVKVKPGSSIVFGGSFTLGTMVKTFTATGFKKSSI